MNTIKAGSVSVNNNTVYSAPFRADPSTTKMALLIRRTAGAGTVAVTVQGGWVDSTVDADYQDTTLTVTGHNVDTPKRIATTDDNVWPAYRVKVVSTGAATIAYRVLFLLR